MTLSLSTHPREPNITNTTKLTVTETDELILTASAKKDGAIEDCEVSEDVATYLFESGAVGTVSRLTGAVAIQTQPNQS